MTPARAEMNAPGYAAAEMSRASEAPGIRAGPCDAGFSD
jgi:hypothetical protein